MPRIAIPRLLWRPFYEHCAKCLEKYCKHETRRRCFFIIMHQVSDKCCNIQSVAKVYELKSQPSYISIGLQYETPIVLGYSTPKMLNPMDVLSLSGRTQVDSIIGMCQCYNYMPNTKQCNCRN